MKSVLLGSGINLIGLHGKAHSGKDSVAMYLCNNYKETWVESFAGPLKRACSQMFGIPEDNFTEPNLKEELFHYWQVSPRVIAQFVGTNLVRDRIHTMFPEGFMDNDFWVRRFAGKINGDLILDGEGEYEAGDTVIVTDVRFQNEYDFIIENGGCIIHIARNGADGNVGIPGHASEAGITFYPERSAQNFYLENNGTVDELFEKVDKIMNSITEHQDKLNRDFISTL